MRDPIKTYLSQGWLKLWLRCCHSRWSLCRYPRWVAAQLALLVFLLGASLTLGLTNHSLHQGLRQQASQTLDVAQQTRNGIKHSEQALNQLAPTDCSDQTLASLRQTIQALPLVSDIGLVNERGEVRCMASWGPVRWAVTELGKPTLTLTGPDRLWSHVDNRLGRFFGEEHVAVRRRGNMLYALNLPNIADAASRGEQFEINMNPAPPFAGTTASYGRVGPSQKAVPALPWSPFSEQVCIEDVRGQSCVMVELTPGRFVYLMTALYGLFLVLVLLLAAWVGIRTHYALTQWCHLRGRLQHALRFEPSRFYCLYQPVFDLNTGRMVGCEVLLRFEDPWGTLLPVDFLPVIESLNKTWTVTELVLQRAHDDLQPLLQEDPKFKISVNIYPNDLGPDNLHTLQQSQLVGQLKRDGGRFCIEIIETELNANSCIQTIQDISRDNDWDLALDDFGTGHANLERLHNINAHVMKIDRSFVSPLQPDACHKQDKIIDTMLDLARNYGLVVIAEGVESRYQADYLRQRGVPLAQGYYFSQPIGAEALFQLYRSAAGVSLQPQAPGEALSA